MSCNLISGNFKLHLKLIIRHYFFSPLLGMFQRLDRMRKNAFSSMILFGEDNNSTISGVWVWRGHELAFPVRLSLIETIYLLIFL